MKHLPDLLTLQHRCPLFCMSVHSSVCLSTFMSTFDIYVKVSILINYKTKQPSNLAWNISLTFRLCDIGAHFSIRLSVRLSVCPSVGRPRWRSWMRVRLETGRSRVRPPPRSATFFRGDWSWNIFYGHSLPSADSRRAVVSFWRKNVHNTG